MNWRWLILDHVPPEVRLSKQERRQLTAMVKRVQLPLSLKVEFFGFAIGFTLLMAWLAAFPWLTAITQSPLLNIVLFWSVVWFVFAAVNHLFRRQHTYRALRVLRYEICESCGYWLRGLGDTVKNCPECGAAREPMPEQSP